MSGRQVLQHSYQTATMSGIADRVTRFTSGLHRGIYWSGAQFGVNYACTLNDFHHALSLTQK
jgi:hypothetical protein